MKAVAVGSAGLGLLLAIAFATQNAVVLLLLATLGVYFVALLFWHRQVGASLLKHQEVRANPGRNC